MSLLFSLGILWMLSLRVSSMLQMVYRYNFITFRNASLTKSILSTCIFARNYRHHVVSLFDEVGRQIKINQLQLFC